MTVSNEDEIQLQETMKLNSKWEIPREKVIINRRLGEGIIIVVVMDDAAFTITPNINISWLASLLTRLAVTTVA